MANENLNPVRTKEEARKRGRNGGIASGKARKKKKELKECLDVLLEKKIEDKKGNKMTGAEALAARLFAEALSGNMKAWELLRDTAGQKPVEKVVTSTVDPAVVEEVEELVKFYDNDTEAGG